MDIEPKCDRRKFLAIAGGAMSALSASRVFAVEKLPMQGGIVVGNPAATAAGAEVLAAGGNAVDAIIAGALVAGVVDVSMCGIGGYGGHMMIGLPDGKVTSIDFNSSAPAAARPGMFPLDDRGRVKGNVDRTGWLSAGVPGTLAGLQLALDRYGTLPFRQLVQPAIRVARNGFAVQHSFSHWLESALPGQKHDPESIRLFSRNGRPLARGDEFRNPELADMLQKLADSGSVEPV
jgi:gamma-glutamyltranspeptidase/glutathione hydrolase